MKFHHAIQSFYHRCIAINVANATLRNYRSFFSGFNKYLTKFEVENLEQIDRQLIRNYFVYLRQNDLSPITVQDRFRILRTFFNYHVSEGNIIISPLERVVKPRIPKVHARTFNNEEIKAILTYFPLDDFLGYRNYTIMCILYSTGIRMNELLNLTVFDVRMDIDTMTVLGKGSKERILPISRILKKVLGKYLREREIYTRNTKYTTPYLIINRNGNKFTQAGIQVIFNQLKDNLGFPRKRLSSHTWRHTFAKNFLLNGGNVFALQKLLGHEDIETTRIYVEYTEKEMKIQNDNFNPLDNNRWQYY